MSTGFKASGKQLEWTLTQKDFVEIMLAIEWQKTFTTGTRHATADEIAELFLRVTYIDMHPYPHFPAMRAALEKECDPENWKKNMQENFKEKLQMLMLLSSLGITPAQTQEGDSTDNQRLQHLSDLLKRDHQDAERLQQIDPPYLFAGLPDEITEKITWHGTQTEFVAFAEYACFGGIIPVENTIKDIDIAAEQLLRFIDIDLSPYPDFRAMRIVLQTKLSHEHFLQKARKMEAINNRQPHDLASIPLNQMSPYGRQTEYHMDVARALALRIGDPDLWNDIALLFDMLFVTDEMMADPW